MVTSDDETYEPPPSSRKKTRSTVEATPEPSAKVGKVVLTGISGFATIRKSLQGSSKDNAIFGVPDDSSEAGVYEGDDSG